MAKHTEKFCCVNTARFLKCAWPFSNIMHEKVNDFWKNKVSLYSTDVVDTFSMNAFQIWDILSHFPWLLEVLFSDDEAISIILEIWN